jgi:predicted outer membrane repeat protein
MHQHPVIANTQITNNSAGYGGAISLRWNDFEHQGQSFLRLLDNVAISSNRGSYGGGAIYCRNGWIDLVGAGSSVFQNTAGGSTEGGSPPSGGAYGGGLLLDQCVARIAAWGFRAGGLDEHRDRPGRRYRGDEQACSRGSRKQRLAFGYPDRGQPFRSFWRGVHHRTGARRSTPTTP